MHHEMGRFKILGAVRKAAKLIKRLWCNIYEEKLREPPLLKSKKGKLTLPEMDYSQRNTRKGQKPQKEVMTGYKENSLQ